MLEYGTSPEKRGFCEHGNNPSTCKKCNLKTPKNIAREDLSGYIQVARGKRNIRYERSGDSVIAKYVTLEKEGRNNVEGLVREATLLQKLQSTGITPRVIGFKRYPSTERPKARLLLEELPGTSLDRMSSENRERFIQKHAQEIVQKTAAALATIAHEGIHVVDINEGTFLFEETNDGTKVRVLDFELGYDEADGVDDTLVNAERFLGKRDPAYSLNEESMPHNTDTLTRTELYRWASILKDLFVPHIPTKVSSETESETTFRDYMSRIEPLIRERALTKVRSAFAEIQGYGEDFAEIINAGEAEYIENHLPGEIDLETHNAQLPFTLPEALIEGDVKLDAGTVSFLSRCLSYIPDQRPRSFAELANASE